MGGHHQAFSCKFTFKGQRKVFLPNGLMFGYLPMHIIFTICTTDFILFNDLPTSIQNASVHIITLTALSSHETDHSSHITPVLEMLVHHTSLLNLNPNMATYHLSYHNFKIFWITHHALSLHDHTKFRNKSYLITIIYHINFKICWITHLAPSLLEPHSDPY